MRWSRPISYLRSCVVDVWSVHAVTADASLSAGLGRGLTRKGRHNPAAQGAEGSGHALG
jgi:hypothetical protein